MPALVDAVGEVPMPPADIAPPAASTWNDPEPTSDDPSAPPVAGSVEELAGWAEAEQPDLRRVAARDGTVTILFSDIEDSTAMNVRTTDMVEFTLVVGNRRKSLAGTSSRSTYRNDCTD